MNGYKAFQDYIKIELELNKFVSKDETITEAEVDRAVELLEKLEDLYPVYEKEVVDDLGLQENDNVCVQRSHKRLINATKDIVAVCKLRRRILPRPRRRKGQTRKLHKSERKLLIDVGRSDVTDEDKAALHQVPAHVEAVQPKQVARVGGIQVWPGLYYATVADGRANVEQGGQDKVVGRCVGQSEAGEREAVP